MSSSGTTTAIKHSLICFRPRAAPRPGDAHAEGEDAGKPRVVSRPVQIGTRAGRTRVTQPFAAPKTTTNTITHAISGTSNSRSAIGWITSIASGLGRVP